MAYLYLLLLWGVIVKELGEYLKSTRISNGVSLTEAAEDLELSLSELENIESGNVRAFKDVYSLKQYVRQYAKYLGLDCEKVIDEFNGFLFEHTSKISLEDIRAAQKKMESAEKKIQSPYTKIYKEKVNIWPFIIGFLILFVIVLICFILVNASKTTPARVDELYGGEKIYEFA